MKAWKIVQRFKLHHIAVWGALFCGWYFFRATDFPTNQLALQVTAIKVSILALLVYLTNYFLIPKLLYKKKYGRFFTLYTVLIFALGLLKLQIIIQLVYPGADLFDNFKTRFYDNIIPLFLLVTTGAATKLISDYLQTQRRLNEIAREKAETELKYLKSQINPHFLFNSLNSIYFLIDKQNTEARKTLLQFSDLLRYQLYDCNADTIEIEKELAYLNDYIRLQKLRKDRHYQVTVNTDETLTGFRIVPLLLMPFVENAFKHISHYNNDENFVHVHFSRNNGSFSFDIENSKEAISSSTEPVGGIGLSNVKRRLDLLYPGKHELSVMNNENTFRVSLKLNINE